jgi:large subunit ribosomal protein L10
LNREQKAEAVDRIAAEIANSKAIYAVDYRGLSVTQAATLRERLRDADATFRVVKNTLTLLAASKADSEQVRELVEGPTAFTFVRGDPALAAKALDRFAREAGVLDLRGGLLDGQLLDRDTVRQIARLPGREQLNAQFAGVVAAPITGLVRGLGALVAGLAIALGQVQDKRKTEEPPPAQPESEPRAEPAPEPEAAAEPEAAPQPEAETPAAEAGEPPDDETKAEEKEAD